MKIEVLFPEVGNLFGDIFNIKYLQAVIPKANFYFTKLNEEPKFIKEPIDLVYLGSMSEKSQEIVISKLKCYTDDIKKYIESNKFMIFTGNSGEILGKYILKDDGNKINGLNIIPFYSKRDMLNRYGYPILGKYKDIDIVGFKSGFTHIYRDNTKNYFLKIKKVNKNNSNTDLEGFKIKNLYVTSILGPILILNPILLKRLLIKLGYRGEIYLYDEMMLAYNKRLEEFKKIIS